MPVVPRDYRLSPANTAVPEIDMDPEDITVLTLPEVVQLTSLSKPTIYTYVRDGNFPRQVRIGPNRVVWRRAEVMRWLDEKAAAREAA